MIEVPTSDVRWSRILVVAVTFALVSGCAGSPDDKLPDGWSGSERIAVVQDHCPGQVMGPPINMNVKVDGQTISVDLHLPSISYVGEFAGFVRREPSQLDVLLRRAEPMPANAEVPAITCYDLSFRLTADPGEYAIRVFFYHYKEGQPEVPRVITSGEVSVPNGT